MADVFDKVRRQQVRKTERPPRAVTVPIRAGGKGLFKLPVTHLAAMPVTKGGSSCANCKFVAPESHSCANPHYVEWNGDDPRLPNLPLDQICSDWWEPAAKKRRRRP